MPIMRTMTVFVFVFFTVERMGLVILETGVCNGSGRLALINEAPDLVQVGLGQARSGRTLYFFKACGPFHGPNTMQGLTSPG